MGPWLTPEEVAAELRVSRRTVYEWLRRRELRGQKAGHQWRVRAEDVKRLLEGGEHPRHTDSEPWDEVRDQTDVSGSRRPYSPRSRRGPDGTGGTFDTQVSSSLSPMSPSEQCGRTDRWPLPNPFNPNQPAGASSFANRRQELAWLAQAMVPSLAPGASGPRNAAILGAWGIGKTSLVYRFRILTAEAPFPLVPVFVSCTTGYGSLLGFADALVDAIVDEIRQRRDWPETLREELGRWAFEVRLPGLAAARRSPSEAEGATSAAQFLRHQLRAVWDRYLSSQGAGAVLILDDVDALLALDANALLVLRAVFQDLHLLGARFGLVVTGPGELFEDLRDVTEPVTRFFERMTLGPFDRRDLEDAVRQPLSAAGSSLEVTESALDWLWEQTQGHPYFVAFIMGDLVLKASTEGWTRLDQDRCLAAWADVFRHLWKEKFSLDWNLASENEQRLLLEIGRRAGADRFRAREFPGFNRALFSRLVAKSLLLRADRGEYRLYHPLFAEFVRALA